MCDESNHADLDTENIVRLIDQDTDLIAAANSYYATLNSSCTRATVFLNYINYDTVIDKIYYELIDKELVLMMELAVDQLDMTTYWYCYDLLNDEQYHIDTLRQDYPDTYDFLMSLKDGRAEIAHY